MSLLLPVGFASEGVFEPPTVWEVLDGRLAWMSVPPVRLSSLTPTAGLPRVATGMRYRLSC